MRFNQISNGADMCDHMVVGLATTNVPMQSMPITTKVTSSNPAHGEMYSIQHYVIKFVSDLRQVSGFPPPPSTLVFSAIKTDLHDISEILLKMV
jgi:hypothetical protein